MDWENGNDLYLLGISLVSRCYKTPSQCKEELGCSILDAFVGGSGPLFAPDAVQIQFLKCEEQNEDFSIEVCHQMMILYRKWPFGCLMENCRVVLVTENIDMSPEMVERDSNLTWNNTLQNEEDDQQMWLTIWKERLLENGITLIVSQKCIDARVQNTLEQAGIYCLERLGLINIGPFFTYLFLIFF